MSPLELKVPPPIVCLTFAAAAWGLRALAPGLRFSGSWIPVVALLLALIGIGVAAAGMLQFFRVGTTVLPTTPSNTSRVVTHGVYAWTRNPMYLGLALVLAAFTLWLAHALSLLAVPAFVAYITRFQIVPEERALLAKFGDDYAAYLRSVRRWI